MNRPNLSATPVRQRGIAAMEMVLMFPVMMALLAGPLLFGRVFYCYEVAEKAASHAATYLSTAPQINMKSSAQAGHEAAVAQAIAEAEVAGLNPGPSAPTITTLCDNATCSGGAIPATVRVSVQMNVLDSVLGVFSQDFTSDDGFFINANVPMRYVGK